MRIGDLIKKRWGKIEPEEQNAVGLIVDMDKSAPSNFQDRRVLKVLMPHGIKFYFARECETVSAVA